MNDVTQVSLAGILAVMIIREVLMHLTKRRQGAAQAVSLEPVLGRLDRIIDRLDDVSEASRQTRMQMQVTSEQTSRLCRAMSILEESISKHWLDKSSHYHKVDL